MTISLCMIARNEERCLAECLESARPWVGEIIVVDTGSCDRTPDIAREFGAAVYDFPWCDDFSAARNESLRFASGDWILYLDADEELPAQTGEKLQYAVTACQPETLGLMLQVLTPSPPGEVGFAAVDYVKLFRNHRGVRFSGHIHEQVTPSIAALGGKLQRTDLYILHSNYDHSPQTLRQKLEREMRLLELDLADNPGSPHVLFHLGRASVLAGEFARAIPAIEQCLQFCRERGGPGQLLSRKSHALLAACHLSLQDLPAARAAIEAGLAEFPLDAEILFRAGMIYAELRELELAARCYETLLTARETGHPDALDAAITGPKAHHNLALVYQQLGRHEEAGEHFRAAEEVKG